MCFALPSMPSLFHLALQSSANVTHDSEVDSTPLGKQFLKGPYSCGLRVGSHSMAVAFKAYRTEMSL